MRRREKIWVKLVGTFDQVDFKLKIYGGFFIFKSEALFIGKESPKTNYAFTHINAIAKLMRHEIWRTCCCFYILYISAISPQQRPTQTHVPHFSEISQACSTISHTLHLLCWSFQIKNSVIGPMGTSAGEGQKNKCTHSYCKEASFLPSFVTWNLPFDDISLFTSYLSTTYLAILKVLIR